jgi:hypothetical protein
MDCNKENSIVLCFLYFSFCIIMGLLVMKVAPGVPVFSTIWRALGLDCCDTGWESPFEPDQDNACEGSVHFYFHVSQDTLNPRLFGKSRDHIFLNMWSAPTGYACFLPRRLHGNVHDFLNQFAYWHFFRRESCVFIMACMWFSHTLDR